MVDGLIGVFLEGGREYWYCVVWFLGTILIPLGGMNSFLFVHVEYVKVYYLRNMVGVSGYWHFGSRSSKVMYVLGKPWKTPHVCSYLGWLIVMVIMIVIVIVSTLFLSSTPIW